MILVNGSHGYWYVEAFRRPWSPTRRWIWSRPTWYVWLILGWPFVSVGLCLRGRL